MPSADNAYLTPRNYLVRAAWLRQREVHFGEHFGCIAAQLPRVCPVLIRLPLPDYTRIAGGARIRVHAHREQPPGSKAEKNSGHCSVYPFGSLRHRRAADLAIAIFSTRLALVDGSQRLEVGRNDRRKSAPIHAHSVAIHTMLTQMPAQSCCTSTPSSTAASVSAQRESGCCAIPGADSSYPAPAFLAGVAGDVVRSRRLARHTIPDTDIAGCASWSWWCAESSSLMPWRIAQVAPLLHPGQPRVLTGRDWGHRFCIHNALGLNELCPLPALHGFPLPRNLILLSSCPFSFLLAAPLPLISPPLAFPARSLAVCSL